MHSHGLPESYDTSQSAMWHRTVKRIFISGSSCSEKQNRDNVRGKETRRGGHALRLKQLPLGLLGYRLLSSAPFTFATVSISKNAGEPNKTSQKRQREGEREKKNGKSSVARALAFGC